MAVLSLLVHCVGVGMFWTQCRADHPHAALRSFLRTPRLREFLSGHADWPQEFGMRDVFALIPLEGLTNPYFCGLGRQGKRVEIHGVRTVQRRSGPAQYRGRRRRAVALR